MINQNENNNNNEDKENENENNDIISIHLKNDKIEKSISFEIKYKILDFEDFVNYILPLFSTYLKYQDIKIIKEYEEEINEFKNMQ